MLKAPAAITLRNTSSMFGRCEGKMMMADKILEVETHMGVCNIEPNRAGVQVTCILGEVRQGVLVITEVLGKGGAVEDLGYLLHHKGDQLAGLLITFGHPPIVGEVADLETGL